MSENVQQQLAIVASQRSEKEMINEVKKTLHFG